MLGIATISSRKLGTALFFRIGFLIHVAYFILSPASCEAPIGFSIGFSKGWDRDTHSCVILEDGRLRCWGGNARGQLGYGHKNPIGDNETPAFAGDLNLADKALQVTVGAGHTCTLLETGNVYCWGWNESGQLGYGHTDDIGDDEIPARVDNVDVGSLVTQIAAGSSHTCALLEGGQVHCWGENNRGQLGYGHTETIGDDETPASADNVNFDSTVIQIVAGSYHTCVLLEGSQVVRCRGTSHGSRLDFAPGTVTQIAAGYSHTCALLEDGQVHCWGVNDRGQLGYGPTEIIFGDETLTGIGGVDLGSRVTQIAAGPSHTCALLEGGRLRCWGANDRGQLGYGHTDDIGDNETLTGVGDVNLGSAVTQIAAGGAHTCALLEGGQVRCWGWNEYGQLGYGHRWNVSNREPVDLGNIDAGGRVIRLWH